MRLSRDERERVFAAVADEWLAAAGPDAVLVDLSTNAPTVVRGIG